MEKKQKVRVLAVDAESLARSGLVQEVSRHPELTICADTDSLSAARVLCEKHRPAVLVLDPHQGDGFTFMKDLRQWSESTQIVAISALEEAGTVLRALQTGALGYVSRRDPVSAVMEAIVKAGAGEHFLGPRAQKALFGGLARVPLVLEPDEIGRFSSRERDVFRLMGSGRGTRAIAEELHVSVKTVETHRQRMREKLGVTTSGELVRRAVLAAVGDRGR